MRLLSLFSGIGAFEKALKNMGIPFELAGYCEIDKYASKAYALIHNVPESMNLGDITQVEAEILQNIDLITYGFPCQDISNAGKQKGFEDENGERTRSGLFFEALRIIEGTKPKFAICENVKALVSKRFEREFATVLESLEEAGYNNYWQVLNAKDYGVPQNRERVFIISIRKDIDHGFTFPTPFPLEKRLKDVLDDKVDEKFYLSEQAVAGMIAHSERYAAKGNGFGAQIKQKDDIGSTLTARYYKDGRECLINEPVCVVSRGRYTGNGKETAQQLEINTEGTTNTITTVQKDNYIIEPATEPQEEPRIIQVGNCRPTKTRANPNQGRVYDTNGIAPALNCMGGGNREPHILEKSKKKQFRGFVKG